MLSNHVQAPLHPGVGARCRACSSWQQRCGAAFRASACISPGRWGAPLPTRLLPLNGLDHLGTQVVHRLHFCRLHSQLALHRMKAPGRQAASAAPEAAAAVAAAAADAAPAAAVAAAAGVACAAVRRTPTHRLGQRAGGGAVNLHLHHLPLNQLRLLLDADADGLAEGLRAKEACVDEVAWHRKLAAAHAMQAARQPDGRRGCVVA